MVNFGPLTAEIGFASWQRYCTASSSGRQPNFAALNRGRHLCSAGRPSGWALAHILVELCFSDAVEKSVTSSKPHDCSEILDSGERSDGVYTVYLGCRLRPVKVYCDMSTDGGGWTVCIIAFSYGNTFMSYVHCVSKKDTTQPPAIISTIFV